MSEGHNPLAQFEIKYFTDIPDIAGMNLNFSNSSLVMFIIIGAITTFFSVSMKTRALVPGRLQSASELMYEFVAGMLKECVGSEGRQYFPIIFTIFIFVLMCNLTGMLPYSFTVTSHFAVTFALAIFIMIGITLIGFIKHGVHFLSLFLPKGLPVAMLIFIFPIELFSYCVRPISLSIRLAANMIAGHVLLKVIGGFVAALGVFGIFPFLFIAVFSGFEIFVAVLQAYIFTILTCVYLNDAINMH